MRNTVLLFMAVGMVGLFLLTNAPLRAHHAFEVEYDSTKPIELRGTIKRVQLMNPHSWITVEVTGADGKLESWEVEAGAPNGLYRRGFNRDSLPIGTKVAVRGYRAKVGGFRINGGSIRVEDSTNRTFLLGGSNPDNAGQDR